MHGHGETVHIPFPFNAEDLEGGELLSYGDKALFSLSDSIHVVLIHKYVKVMQCKAYFFFFFFF